MRMNNLEFNSGIYYGRTLDTDLLPYFIRHIEALVIGVSESGVHSFSQIETNTIWTIQNRPHYLISIKHFSSDMYCAC
jgi:hypothetical protein